MVEASIEIRRAVDTGKVIFGQKQCQKELLKGNGKLVIFSNNIPVNDKEKLLQIISVENKQCFEFNQNGLNLGSICGKPFVVSVLMIMDEGKSKVLDLVKK